MRWTERWSHQAEIRRIYGYRPFSSEGVEPELVEWLRARAWVTAERSRVLSRAPASS